MISTIAGTGASGSTGDGGLATNATFVEPYGIARLNDGSLLVTDKGANKVRRIVIGANITTFAGTGNAGFSGDGGQASAAQFNAPTGIASDKFDTVYVADTNNNRVRAIDSAGFTSTIAGTGLAGSSGATYARDAQLNAPTAVAVGNDLDVYIGDNSGRITGVGTNNEFFVQAGTGTKGYSLNGTATTTKIGRVVGLAIFAGNMYFIDRDAGRIRLVNVGDQTIHLSAAELRFIPGAPGHTANQMLLSFKTATTVPVQHIRVPLTSATGTPTIAAKYGTSQSPAISLDASGFIINLPTEETLRANTTYAFVIENLSPAAQGPRQVEVALLDGSSTLQTFGHTNTFQTNGPGNQPAFGQAGFRAPLMAVSTAGLSGTSRVSVDPSVATSGSATRTLASSGNLNGQTVLASLGSMTKGATTFSMLGTAGVLPASMPANTWGIGVSGGAGSPTTQFSGGKVAGTSGSTAIYDNLAVGSAVTMSFHAKVDYLQPAGRYQSTWTLSASVGH